MSDTVNVSFSLPAMHLAATIEAAKFIMTNSDTDTVVQGLVEPFTDQVSARRKYRYAVDARFAGQTFDTFTEARDNCFVEMRSTMIWSLIHDRVNAEVGRLSADHPFKGPSL